MKKDKEIFYSAIIIEGGVLTLLYLLCQIILEHNIILNWFFIIIILILYTNYFLIDNNISKRIKNNEIISTQKTNERRWANLGRTIRGIFGL